MDKRHCVQSKCNKHAVAVVAFDYENSEIIVDSIKKEKIEHTYELCADHINNFVPPKKWKLINLHKGKFLPDERDVKPKEETDDIFAIASVIQTKSSTRKKQQVQARKKAEEELISIELDPATRTFSEIPQQDFAQMFGPVKKFKTKEEREKEKNLESQNVEVVEKGHLKLYTFKDEK